MKLLIRSLPSTVSESDLLALFEAFGTVQSCTLVTDKETGYSKGFGFVEIPKVGEAKAAMKSLNGKVISGTKIRVKKADVKKNDTEQAAGNDDAAKDEEPKT